MTEAEQAEHLDRLLETIVREEMRKLRLNNDHHHTHKDLLKLYYEYLSSYQKDYDHKKFIPSTLNPTIPLPQPLHLNFFK